MNILHKIPDDIYINHIAPYLYQPQHSELTRDIEDFYLTTQRIRKSRKIMKELITSSIYNMNIVQRSYMIKNDYPNALKTYIRVVYYYPLIMRFNFIWGLMLPTEREKSLNEIKHLLIH